MGINVQELSEAIVIHLGGAENIESMDHCVTRLRFVLVDRTKAKIEGLKAVKGVLGVVTDAGHLQVVLGANMYAVFDEIRRRYSIESNQ